MTSRMTNPKTSASYRCSSPTLSTMALLPQGTRHGLSTRHLPLLRLRPRHQIVTRFWQRSQPRNKGTSTDASVHRTSSFEHPNEPKTTEEAHASPQAQQWRDAEIEEINSLNERGVWTIVRRPTDQHVMDCKFAYRLKDA